MPAIRDATRACLAKARRPCALVLHVESLQSKTSNEVRQCSRLRHRSIFMALRMAPAWLSLYMRRYPTNRPMPSSLDGVTYPRTSHRARILPLGWRARAVKLILARCAADRRRVPELRTRDLARGSRTRCDASFGLRQAAVWTLSRPQSSGLADQCRSTSHRGMLNGALRLFVVQRRRSVVATCH